MQTCINNLISYYLEHFNVYGKGIREISQQFLTEIRKLRESTKPDIGIIFFFLETKRGCNATRGPPRSLSPILILIILKYLEVKVQIV